MKRHPQFFISTSPRRVSKVGTTHLMCSINTISELLDHSHKPYQAAKAFMKTLRAALILRSTSFGEGVDANPKRTRRKASPRDI